MRLQPFMLLLVPRAAIHSYLIVFAGEEIGFCHINHGRGIYLLDIVRQPGGGREFPVDASRQHRLRPGRVRSARLRPTDLPPQRT